MSRERQRRWELANPEKYREQRRAASARWRALNPGKRQGGPSPTKLKCGVDRAVRDGKLLQQQGRCAICATTNASIWCMDHDHVTGYIRDVLCHPCNIAIGMLRDDAERCRAAAGYLDRHAALQSLL